MRRTSPKKIMTKRRMPAMTPAILTVWSVCFSGSTASGLWVAAPEKSHNALRSNKEGTTQRPWNKSNDPFASPGCTSVLAYFTLASYWSDYAEDGVWLVNTVALWTINTNKQLSQSILYSESKWLPKAPPLSSVLSGHQAALGEIRVNHPYPWLIMFGANGC